MLNHLLTLHHPPSLGLFFPFIPHLLSTFFPADVPSTKVLYKSRGVICATPDASESFSKHSPRYLLRRKGGKCMFIHLFRSLIHSHILLYLHTSSPFPPSLYLRIRIHRYTPRNSSPIPFIERFIVRCEQIFIVRMIVNVRTLWLSLIQLRLWYFVATFGAIYNRRISDLQRSIRRTTRYVVLYCFPFLARKGLTIHQEETREVQNQIWDKWDYRRPRRRK